MKLGISTWCLLNLDLASAVRAIGDSGSEYIELWGEVPHAFPGWADSESLKQALSSYDMALTLHAPFTDLNLGWPFEPVKAAIARTVTEFVRFGESLGAKVVTVHPGSAHSEALLPRARDSAASALREMVRVSGGTLTVSVENQAGSRSEYYHPLTDTPDGLDVIAAEVEGLRLTLDTGHAHVSGQDPLAFAKRMGDRLVEVHLSDNHGEVDEHLIPGKGTASLEPLLGYVKGTDAYLCLELDPHRYSREEVFGALRETKEESTR